MRKIKTFIRKTPVIGFLAWWVYSAIKTPLKLKGLAEEIIALKQNVSTLNAQLTRESQEIIALKQNVSTLNAQLTRESQEIIALKQNVSTLNAQLTRESQEIIALKQNVSTLNAQLHKEMDIDAVYRTKGVIEADSYLVKAWDSSPVLTSHPIEKRDIAKTFYYAFEILFRGQPADIEMRLSQYLPYIVEANNLSRGSFFLDIGCGRGEFLNLLHRHDISVKGIDTNKFMVDLLKKDGFDVIQSDGLAFLLTLQDSILKGLTLFQIIEHLDFKYFDSLLAAAFQKLATDSIIILESINPYCPISMNYFYLDPSHVRPMPSDLAKFMLEWHGFVNVEIVYSTPLPKSQRYDTMTMNYRDYAVIGWKRNNPVI